MRTSTGHVALSAGSRHGVRKYQVFEILRNATPIAQMRITTVFEDFSGGLVIAGDKHLRAGDAARWDRTFVQPKYHSHRGWDRVREVLDTNNMLHLDRMLHRPHNANRLRELKSQRVDVDRILADEEGNEPRVRSR